MAKERAEKPHKKAEKPEKKVSKDKVKKQKKEKSKRVETPEDSDNESSKLEDTPVAAEESSAESEVKPKKEKKSKKAALEKAVAESASNGTKLPVRPTVKDSDSSSDSSDDDDDDDNGPALFTIDTKPTPIDPNSIPQKAYAADEDDKMSLSDGGDGESKGPKKMKPPTGLNRQARRRIRIIEKQREKIAKELGAGATAAADEVQAKLDKWVEDYDSKAAARIEKKQRRKDKEAARIRNKKGKLLTGRRLKERKKVLDKMDKKASKRQGLSAQNVA